MDAGSLNPLTKIILNSRSNHDDGNKPMVPSSTRVTGKPKPKVLP